MSTVLRRERLAGVVQRLSFSWLAIALLGGVACDTPPSESRNAVSSVEDGQRLFADHCAACHGADAAGNGPVAHALISVPADLTRIASRRGDVFPHEEVSQTIDGRAGRPGHSGPEMPRWGEFWDRDDLGTDTRRVPTEIGSITRYLESIQVTDTPKPEPAGDARAVRERMNALADALEAALPAVFSDLAFSDPERRAAFGEAVTHLGADAAALEIHAANQSQTFEPLARSLARDAERARDAFETGELRKTRFRLGELLENCVACHSRLPSTRRYADRLVGAIDPKTLAPREELRLLLATRQFETARDRYETLLRGHEVDALERPGLLTDYLIVSLRVLGDSERPRRVLGELLERDDSSSYRARNLRSWIASLDRLPAKNVEPSLEWARGLLQRADARTREDDIANLVYDIAASGQLFRFVESETATESELADAYYLLGVAETRIRRPVGRERWDDYLETAIRLAPGTPTGLAAFQLYEENRQAQFDRFSVLVLPREELQRIEVLRNLALGTEPPG